MHYECNANPGIEIDKATLELCRMKRCERIIEVNDDGLQSKNRYR
jgi:hypothetical protein